METHFEDIRKFANAVEDRLQDEDCTPEAVRRDNAEMFRQCVSHKENYILIDEEYRVDIEL